MRYNDLRFFPLWCFWISACQALPGASFRPVQPDQTESSCWGWLCCCSTRTQESVYSVTDLHHGTDRSQEASLPGLNGEQASGSINSAMGQLQLVPYGATMCKMMLNDSCIGVSWVFLRSTEPAVAIQGQNVVPRTPYPSTSGFKTTQPTEQGNTEPLVERDQKKKQWHGAEAEYGTNLSANLTKQQNEVTIVSSLNSISNLGELVSLPPIDSTILKHDSLRPTDTDATYNTAAARLNFNGVSSYNEESKLGDQDQVLPVVQAKSQPTLSLLVNPSSRGGRSAASSKFKHIKKVSEEGGWHYADDYNNSSHQPTPPSASPDRGSQQGSSSDSKGHHLQHATWEDGPPNPDAVGMPRIVKKFPAASGLPFVMDEAIPPSEVIMESPVSQNEEDSDASMVSRNGRRGKKRNFKRDTPPLACHDSLSEAV